MDSALPGQEILCSPSNTHVSCLTCCVGGEGQAMKPKDITLQKLPQRGLET